MDEIVIRHVLPMDLDECFTVETSGFPPEEAATSEAIQLRIDTFPFVVKSGKEYFRMIGKVYS